MNGHLRFVSTLIALSVIGGCASTTVITGETQAGNTLKSDVARQVSMWAKTQTQCPTVDAIQTQVVRVNPVGTGKTAAARQYGSVDERWVVQLCNQSLPFAVTLTPDGQGGTYFSTSREK